MECFESMLWSLPRPLLMRQQIPIYLSFHAKLILFSMNPLGGTHICFWQIFFLVLPPRFWGDCRPSSRVAVAVMSFSSRRRPHRSHLPSGTQGGKRQRPNLCGGPAPPHSPRARDRNLIARKASSCRILRKGSKGVNECNKRKRRNHYGSAFFYLH